MSTLSSANVTDVNLVLQERTHMRLCLNMLIFTHNLGNWLIVSMFHAALPGPCESNPCRSRGQCILDWINATYATYECECEKGFHGDHCEHGRYAQFLNCRVG